MGTIFRRIHVTVDFLYRTLLMRFNLLCHTDHRKIQCHHIAQNQCQTYRTQRQNYETSFTEEIEHVEVREWMNIVSDEII